jgi:hypothetical protein
MSKFKVGDPVRVISNPESVKTSCEFNSKMSETKGTVQVISEVKDYSGSTRYRLKDCHGWNYIKGWLTLHNYPNPPHKHNAIIKEWADGANVRGRVSDDADWFYPTHPQWLLDHQYEVVPPKTDKQLKLEKLQKKADEVAAEIRELTED